MGNQIFLKLTSVEFQRQIKMTKCAGIKNMETFVRFAIKKAAKLVHHCPVEYNIVRSMREEIEFFARYLKPDSGVKWEAPIAYLIDRTPFASTFGDACLESGGGYSSKLKLWYFVSFPKDVVLRTLKHLKNNKDKNLISINVLEFVIVIMNYCAAWTVVVAGQGTDDPHPVLLNAVDNTSAHSWTTNTCKSSRIGRLLAKFFCYLQMDYVLGINSTWISTTDNYVADDISRLKKLFSKSSQQFVFDFSSLQQKYPELKNCCFFPPSQDLLLILWDILLLEKLPSLKQVRDLKQSGLAKLIVDPVGPESGWQFVLAIHVKYVMTGVNYLNKNSVRSATCKGYALDAARLFTLRNYPSPVDFSDPRCWTRIIVKNLEREEAIARQRKPLDASIHAEIIRFAREASKDSLEEAVSNVIAAGKFLGWRASEHSQTSQDKVDYHKYPSGKEVMKAINGNDVIYTDKKGKLIEIKKKSDLKRVHAVTITFRHQKNRQNGQQIRLLALRLAHP